MRNFKTILASSVAFGAVFSVSPALAQDTGAGVEEAEENTIIVTARRQSETLAEVPTAITVFTADTLKKQASSERMSLFN